MTKEKESIHWKRYKEEYDGLTRGELSDEDNPLYQQLLKTREIYKIPLKRQSNLHPLLKKYEEGFSKLTHQRYVNMPYSELIKEEPEFVKELKEYIYKNSLEKKGKEIRKRREGSRRRKKVKIRFLDDFVEDNNNLKENITKRVQEQSQE
jgi:hypothetical protein